MKIKVKFVVFVDDKNNGGATWIDLGYLTAMIKANYEFRGRYFQLFKLLAGNCQSNN